MFEEYISYFNLFDHSRHDSRFGWLPVTTGYKMLVIRNSDQLTVITGYHWSAELWSQAGYQNYGLTGGFKEVTGNRVTTPDDPL